MKKISPAVLALLALVLGWGLLGAGVYLLAGLGWALISIALPFLGLAAVIVRGLGRVE